jgi:aerobic-type carbon monoxide dehydrogenase small subunit (CoxS/CutS family)
MESGSHNKNRKRKKTYTRRAFLKGVGGGAIGATVATGLLGSVAPGPGQASDEAAVFESKSITLTVNGKLQRLTVEPRETLLHVLRERLRLTGTKRTCDRGECGGCTVLLDGKPVYACMVLAARADGRQVRTVEGLAVDGKLHPVQQAFIDKDAYQCGFCTPGFIMSGVALLEANPSPNNEEIKAALSGNICRCGNYQKIREAVAVASERMRGERR